MSALSWQRPVEERIITTGLIAWARLLDRCRTSKIFAYTGMELPQTFGMQAASMVVAALMVAAGSMIEVALRFCMKRPLGSHPSARATASSAPKTCPVPALSNHHHPSNAT